MHATLPEITSTSSYLINQQLYADRFTVCLAELQTAGRGRSVYGADIVKKNWHSPFGSNIYCSIAWNYVGNQNSLLGLSLVAGITVAEVLADLNCQNIGLKWPNDIFLNNKKTAGILTEIIGEPNGNCKLVIGFGINVLNNYNQQQQLDNNKNINQIWANVADNLIINNLNINNLNRNQIIINLLNKFILYYKKFINNGLAEFKTKWQDYDILLDKNIKINISGNLKSGRALGIDNQGALLVDIAGSKQVFHSGEVSVSLE
jgi:BirA family biotin operon repressor/biotin-[acetyl-CoA-carboxylase] ligase